MYNILSVNLEQFKALVSSIADANETYRETFDLDSQQEAYVGVDILHNKLTRSVTHYTPMLEDVQMMINHVPHLIKLS